MERYEDEERAGMGRESKWGKRVRKFKYENERKMREEKS